MNNTIRNSYLLKQARKFVKAKFAEHAALPFHSYKHARSRIELIRELAKPYKLNKEEKFSLSMAALFTDLGFVDNKSEPLKVAAALAADFLKKYDAERSLADSVSRTIRYQGSPTTTLQKILADACTYYYGTGKFKQLHKKLQKEREYLEDRPIDRKQWWIDAVKMLSVHQYYTPHAREKFLIKKNKNLTKLLKKIKDE